MSFSLIYGFRYLRFKTDALYRFDAKQPQRYTVALKGLELEVLFIYLVNVMVWGKKFQEESDRLDEVFLRISSAGLKLKPRIKFVLFQKSVVYLAHVVT